MAHSNKYPLNVNWVDENVTLFLPKLFGEMEKQIASNGETTPLNLVNSAAGVDGSARLANEVILEDVCKEISSKSQNHNPNVEDELGASSVNGTVSAGNINWI